ncbi:MAG: Crp/Fnr family transcriptional regulator, partial [Leadbetterella sp.]|nr:Crp/Fnr family transcriptional regulator [Leadbetterella sp.]
METILFEFISKYISLTEEEKRIIVSSDIFRTAKKGTVLLKAGQRSKETYFVLKGCLRTIYIIDGDE